MIESTTVKTLQRKNKRPQSKEPSPKSERRASMCPKQTIEGMGA
jgi:hypothetical protein